MQDTGDTTAQGGNQASIIKSAAAMSLGTLLSRILGLVRDTLMAALFPRLITDAYVVSFRLPNLFRRILGEGSLAASFVPIFVDAKTLKAGESLETAKARAEEFANAIFTILTAFSACLSVAGVVFMKPIMSVMVSGEGYQAIEGKFELTVKMSQIMFSFLFLVMTYAFLMSILNAYKKFFWAAVAPAGFNLLLVISALLPAFNFAGDQLAWGVIAGGIVQLVMVIVPLYKIGHMPTLTTKIWSKKLVPKFFMNLVPSMVGLGLSQILIVLNVIFASRLPEGSHSFIYLADRLLEFPQSLLSVSLGVALLPTLSEHWARGEKSKLISLVHEHVKLLTFLTLPAAAGLYLLSEPIVRLVYERGHFSKADTLMTAQILRVYCLVLITAGIHRVTVPAFYAIKNTWLPALNSAFCVVVHYFIASWATDNYGLLGLVSATAVTGIFNLFILLISFKIYFDDLGLLSFFKSVLWSGPALMSLAGVCILGDRFIIPLFGDLFGVALTIVSSVILFFLVGTLLKNPEAKKILRIFARRI